MWLASYAATLAEGFPAWTPHHIVFELSYLAGCVHEHTLLRRARVWTVPPKPPAPRVNDDGIDDLLNSDEGLDEFL